MTGPVILVVTAVSILASDDHERAGMGGVEVRRVVTDEERAP